MTRRHGLCDLAAPAQPNDHAAWGYSTRTERAQVASAWLASGLAGGYRALYVADLAVDELLMEVARVPDAVAAAARGALVVMPSAQAYDLNRPIDPDEQLAMYAGAVDDAVADGYVGLRVAADITPLVGDSARLASHLVWEEYADRYIAEHPLSPLCLYDARRLRGLEPIACAHAMQGPTKLPLSVFALDGGRAVCGEIDAFIAPTFAEVLRRLPDDEVVLDLRGIEFIDARSAWTLHGELLRVRAAGRTVRITGASAALALVWHACGFDETLPLAS